MYVCLVSKTKATEAENVNHLGNFESVTNLYKSTILKNKAFVVKSNSCKEEKFTTVKMCGYNAH